VEERERERYVGHKVKHEVEAEGVKTLVEGTQLLVRAQLRVAVVLGDGIGASDDV
jgi:hypothetical protein